MNLNEIEAKCFIMALFIRDDGLRFLLGSGAYEFKDSQLMFAGNTIENDVVSIQGNDGYMLAGQVRRPSTQVFDGYIGDASVSKSEVEGYRRDFMAFFQKNHFYTVVYVMADGSAIQRRRGFLVDAPTSQELWQMYPEYHVALNFEDVNYYKYSENDDGEETYAKSADIGLAKVQYGGLIWDNDSDIEISGSGTNITLAGTMEGGAIESVELNGDTEQTTYSGKNLANPEPLGYADMGITATYNATTGEITLSGTATAGYSIPFRRVDQTIPAGTYTIKQYGELSHGRMGINFRRADGTQIAEYVVNTGTLENTFTLSEPAAKTYLFTLYHTAGQTVEGTVKFQLESGSTATSFEPYVGGTASPNPDYPQEVKTVTGEQTITVSDGQGNEQEYKVNLGKNLFDKDNFPSIDGFIRADNYTLTSSASNKTTYIQASPNTTYTFSGFVLGVALVVGTFNKVPALGDVANVRVLKGASDTTVTITTGASDSYIAFMYKTSSDTLDTSAFQIERGSAATTYAPYFTPIELCKIGTYQDYIYKSGEDWYIHKEVRHLSLAVPDMDSSSEQYPGWSNISVFTNDIGAGTNGGLARVTSYVSNVTLPDSTSTTETRIAYNTRTPYEIIMMLKGSTTQTQWKSQYPNLTLELYYGILNTPTDTQITNADLIAQLDALNDATTYDNNTYITVSGDLASPLEITVISIGGGGVVWDENGAEWEAGGGGEIVIVNVDSIENILPVWTIRGEAENPTLTNLTTGMSITYNGTVASGQTLVIDLLNKTAKLNGTSVISDVSGQWVEFKPGNNRVSYSTENANAPDSTIEWQEVVG